LIVTGEAAAVFIAAAFFLSQPPVAGLERAGSMLPKPTIIGMILDASANGKLLFATTTIDVTAANVFRLVSGTTRQTFELMSVYNSSTSLEGLRLKAVSTANYEIGSFQGSIGGSNRGISFGVYERATPTVLTRWMELTAAGVFTVYGATLENRRYGDNAFASLLQMRKYRGTESLPTAMLLGDLIGQVLFQGYNGTTIATSAAVQAQATDNFSASSTPTRLLFNTCPTSSATSAVRMAITEAGLVSIGPFTTATPLAAVLTLVGNNNSGAENNTLRFHDSGNNVAIGQVLGKIEFYSGDASAPGVGVKAWIASVVDQSFTANASIAFGTDTNTGTVTERMRITSAGVVRTERLIGQTAEVTYTPVGTTQTIPLDAGRCQTLSLATASGTPVLATLTVPTIGAADGSIILKQGATVRSVTWGVSAGSIKWLGTQPTWGSDAANAVRNVRWRWDGTVMYFEASAAG
jgi:hypothetical protein